MTTDPTRTGGPEARRPGMDEGRFAPGTIVAGRYRIVARLGAGGMGEIYRADDLKIGQPVALKFLPASLTTDPGRLRRLFEEVRLAREVSHPSVCRVHDVGEVDGCHFLTMEYVDGEDLGSLLRRIGPLPQAKGLEIARQICAGLAAAHERGVVHRDLKPANVMIDGRGRARLTDFGLAVGVGHAPGEVAGTPAYMAPEQFAGEPVTPRTDLYGLGLVLYELFTGRAAFPAASVPELERLHRETPPPRPSSLIPELDRPLERVILSCLEKEPAARPRSALAVAAALPGGNALAAMVAAGETPPPELVAAAGDVGALRPWVAWACLLALFAGLPLAVRLSERITLFRQVPFDTPPLVLADRARELTRRLAPAGPTQETAWGFDYPARWRAGALPPASLPRAPIVFWYREAPAALEAIHPLGAVSPNDPSPAVPGMRTVILDTRGRLVGLLAVPSGGGAQSTTAEPDWRSVLAEAGIDLTSAQESAPRLRPPAYASTRRAWMAAAADPPERVRIEAAAEDGRLVWLRVLGEHEEVLGDRPPANPLVSVFVITWLVTLIGAVLLARRNLSTGRGDRAGALRLALVVLALRLPAALLQVHHTSVLGREQSLLIQALARAAYSAGLAWLLYVAIEPTVRRHWPDSLISWSRLLSGRLRDPLVGRDVLVGMVFAVGACLVWVLSRIASGALGRHVEPYAVDLSLLDARAFVSWFLLNLISSVSGALWVVVSFVVLRMALRGTGRASVALVVLLFFLSGVGTGLTGPADVVAGLAVSSVFVFLLRRFGFLALVASGFVISGGQLDIPATLDLGAWYAFSTTVWLIVTGGLAIAAFVVSLGGRPAFRGVFEEA